jgi:type IV pilus assembly protein PilX
MNHELFQPTVRRQRGAALFISLMFLIILTLIGLSAANVGVMQERMAGSVRDTNLAFQEAEETLRGIEQRVREITELGTDGGLGQIPIWSDAQSNMGIQRNDCTLTSIDLASNGGWWEDSPDTDGQYVVVELTGGAAGGAIVGSACRPMQSQSAGNPGEAAVYFLIAARAFGPTGNAQAIVQSIYFWP